MAENYKHRYEMMKWMLDKYQDEIVPGLREQLEKLVEVVRCKDCEHWHEKTGWCNQHSSFIDDRGVLCTQWESNDWKMFDENDFCSYGERKDNATD